MVKTSFSTTWKRSMQPRKQRKYRYNAPLHVKQKMVHVHLSRELRSMHGMRNTQVRTGDKVKVLRGKFSKKDGKVEKVNLKGSKVFITGLEVIKKDGAKVPIAFDPSNLMITSLDLTDKKRKVSVKKKTEKTEKKEEKKVEEKKEAPKVEDKKEEKKEEKVDEENKQEEKKQ